MSRRNLVIITKILLFYSLFYVFMKLVLIVQGAWLIPNLVLIFPFLILGSITGWEVNKDSFSWYVATAGVLWVILTRIYESRWVLWVHQQVEQL